MKPNEKSYRRITIILLVLLCGGFLTSLSSQVTIGSTDPPLAGSLLDFKDSNDLTGNQNSKKGVIIPRVALSDLNNLFPMFTGSELDYASQKTSHSGLIVYNVSNNLTLKPGLYQWDGTIWKRLSNSTSLGIQGQNGLSLASVDNVALGGNLTQNTAIDLGSNNLIFDASNGRVGIGTTIPPQALLDVNGAVNAGSTMTVGNTLTANGRVVLKGLDTLGTKPGSALLMDTLSGMVYAIKTPTGNKYLYNLVRYDIICSPGYGLADWIADFNTRIPIDKYTVIVVGSIYTTPKDVNNPSQLVGMETKAYTPATFGSKSVYADTLNLWNKQIDGCWHLTADYSPGTAASANYNDVDMNPAGTWTVYCLIINNSIVQSIKLDDFYNMPPNSTIGWAPKPNGL